MPNKITSEIELLFTMKPNEKSQAQIGKNLKGILENAVITFDEAETKKNLQPIIRMIEAVFSKAGMHFDTDGLFKMPSQQALQSLANISVDRFQQAFDKALANSGGVSIDFGDVDFSSMVKPLKELSEEVSGISKRLADETKKSVSDIELSIKRLNKARPKTINAKKIVEGVEQKVKEEVSRVDLAVSQIEKTLEGVNTQKTISRDTAAISQLTKARDVYAKSVSDGAPWEVQYQHMITFVSKYEALSKKIKPIIDTDHPEFSQLYELLSPKASGAKISLEHFVDVAKGNELSEYKNQPWARESTLKEIRDTLKSGIAVKDGGRDAGVSGKSTSNAKDTGSHGDSSSDANRQRINAPDIVHAAQNVDNNAQAVADHNSKILHQRIEEKQKQIRDNAKKIEDLQNNIKYIRVYKGIAIDEGMDDIQSRDDVYNQYGADYYSPNKNVAKSYAEGATDGHIVVANVYPEVSLEFDAQQYHEKGDYQEVVTSSKFIEDFKNKLKEHYAKIITSEKQLRKQYDEIDALPFGTRNSDSESNQFIMNDEAAKAGFDSIIFDNILDYASNDNIALEGERVSSKHNLGKTIAVLKDSILKIIGFYDVLDGKVSKKMSTNIPDGYFMPHQIDEDGDIGDEPQAIYPDDLPQIMSEISALKEKNKSLKSELDALKALIPDATDAGSLDADSISDSQSAQAGQVTTDNIEEETNAHKENTAAIQEEIKATKELNEVQSKSNNEDVNAQIAHSQKVISIQKEWLDYLDTALNDDNFKTDGKLAATNQLKNATSTLNDHMAHPEAHAGEEMRGDKLIVMWKKAYEEAERQGVAQSTLTRNYINAVHEYEDALQRLQAQQSDSLQIIAREEAKINALQQPAQSDVKTHQENTAAIIEETHAVEKLNEEKLKSAINTESEISETSQLSTEVKASINTEELRSLLSSIVYNVKISHDSEFANGNNITIDEGVLKSILQSIVYNVKLNRDGEDGQADTVSIDEGTLKNVLQNIIYNVKLSNDDQESGKVSIDEGILKNILQSLTYNVRLSNDDSDKQDNTIAIDESGLKSILQSIVYNVQLTHDDSDRQSSKIAIDIDGLKSVLEQITFNVKLTSDGNNEDNKVAIDDRTNSSDDNDAWKKNVETLLTRIKLHTHNTVRQIRDNLADKIGGSARQSAQTDSEPWARNDTLINSIAPVLNAIKDNTERITSIKDPVLGSKTDNYLVQILSTLNGINRKIVGQISGVVKSNTASPSGTTTSKNKHKDGTISHGQAEGESGSMQKMLDYYYWLEEQVEQYKDNVEYTKELNDVINRLTPAVNDFYDKLAESGKEDPAWLAPLEEKHNLHMSKIRGGQSLSDQNSYIREWITLSKKLGDLDAKINSGIFDDKILLQAKQEREFVLSKIKDVLALIDDPMNGFESAGEANFDGHYSAINEQKSKALGKLVSQYEKLGILEAKAETSGAFVEREKYAQLQNEIQAEIQKIGINQEQNDELLNILRTHQEVAYVNAKNVEYAKEQKKLFTEYVNLTKQIGKLDGVINSDAVDSVSKHNAQIQKYALMQLVDDIRPKLDLTREDLIAAGTSSIGTEEKASITQRQKAFTDLADKYKELGTWQARAEAEKTAIANGNVKRLQEEIAEKVKSLNLSMDELSVLTQIAEEVKKRHSAELADKQADKQTKQSDIDKDKLLKDYERLGKLRAQFEKDGDLGIREELIVLAEKVGVQKESLNLTQSEISELRKKSDEAYIAEKRIINASQKQDAINKESRAAEKAKAYAIAQRQKEKDIHKQQVEAEIVRELVGLYEKLGKAKFLNDADQTQELRNAISDKRSQLSSVDYATDMRFKHAKDKGFNDAHINAQNEALKERENLIKRINKLYHELGSLEGQVFVGVDSNLTEQLKNEISDKLSEINELKGVIGEISPALQKQFDDSALAGWDKSEKSYLRKTAKQDDSSEVVRLQKISALEKEIGSLRAKADGTPHDGVKTAIEREIALREELIALQREGLAMDAEQEGYEKKRRSDLTKQTEQRVKAERDAIAAAFKERERQTKQDLSNENKLKKRQAMTGKSGNAIGRAESVWLNAEDLEQDGLPEEFKKRVKEYRESLDDLILKLHEVNTAEEISDTQVADLQAQTAEVNKQTEVVGRLVSEYQKLSGDNVDEEKSRATNLDFSDKSLKLSDYENQMKAYVHEVTNGQGQIKSFNAETKTLTYTVKTGAHEFTEYTVAVRNLDHQLVSVQGTTKRTETFFEATARKMRELTSYFSGMAIFSRVSQEFRRGIQYIREIDLALTELKKVTDATEETYDEFLKTAAQTGSRLGSTISAVTEATATFAKLGYSMQQASEMAEAAIVYKNVGDNIASTEDAADSIISTMKGFGLEASEAMAIVDKFNEVGE